jgi:type II secretory pathway pseudopilin PulG
VRSENGKMLEESPVRRRAMTLTELIVVMAVMMILVSAVVVAVFQISSKGPVKGTQGLLQKLAVGLEGYRATYRMYPPEDNVAAYPDNTHDSYQRSSWVVWYSLEYTGQGQFMTPVSSTYKAAGGGFTDSNTSSVQTWYYYQDAWRQPLRYVCYTPYTQYTLTSGGPDLIMPTNPDAADADDIVVP